MVSGFVEGEPAVIKQITDPAVIIQLLDDAWAGPHPPTSLFGEPRWPLRDHPLGHPVSTTLHPYWDILRAMPTEPSARHASRALPPHEVDQPFVARYTTLRPDRLTSGIDWDLLRTTYCWPIISPADLAFLAEVIGDRAVVEVGAGTGYLAWQLTQLGIDVAAYDLNPHGNIQARSDVQYHPVAQGGPDAAAHHPERVLLLSWPPPHSDMARRTLAAYPGDTLIHIGEWRGGCCAPDDFFDLVDHDWVQAGDCPDHLSYWEIKCRIKVFQRASVLQARTTPILAALPRLNITDHPLPPRPPEPWFADLDLTDQAYTAKCEWVAPRLDRIVNTLAVAGPPTPQFLTEVQQLAETEQLLEAVDALHDIAPDDLAMWMAGCWLAAAITHRLGPLRPDQRWDITDSSPRDVQHVLTETTRERIRGEAGRIVTALARDTLPDPVTNADVHTNLYLLVLLCDALAHARNPQRSQLVAARPLTAWKPHH